MSAGYSNGTLAARPSVRGSPLQCRLSTCTSVWRSRATGRAWDISRLPLQSNEERRRRLRVPREHGETDALASPGLGRPGAGQHEGSGILRELVLVNFRNYGRLALHPGEAMTVLLGDNGQGKSNILEAIYFLATTRSPRAGSDRELVHWRARRDAKIGRA